MSFNPVIFKLEDIQLTQFLPIIQLENSKYLSFEKARVLDIQFKAKARFLSNMYGESFLIQNNEFLQKLKLLEQEYSINHSSILRNDGNTIRLKVKDSTVLFHPELHINESGSPEYMPVIQKPYENKLNSSPQDYLFIVRINPFKMENTQGFSLSIIQAQQLDKVSCDPIPLFK